MLVVELTDCEKREKCERCGRHCILKRKQVLFGFVEDKDHGLWYLSKGPIEGKRSEIVVDGSTWSKRYCMAGLVLIGAVSLVMGDSL